MEMLERSMGGKLFRNVGFEMMFPFLLTQLGLHLLQFRFRLAVPDVNFDAPTSAK